jgi:hypothetical protein
MTTMPLELVTGALERHGSRRQGRSWQCPAHDDRTPSLRVDQDRDGTVLLHCHAGCPTEAVVHKLGLQLRDLFPSSSSSPWGRGGDGEGWTPRGPATATYRYTDEDGRLLFGVCRTIDKQFPQWRPDPAAKGGRSWRLTDPATGRWLVRRVLYRLPTIIEAARQGQTIYLAEGEKDVHALQAAGVVATTSPGGAAAPWLDSYTQALAGAGLVVVVADRDPPDPTQPRNSYTGQRRARTIARKLTTATIPVRLVMAAHGKDAADHLAAGYGLEDFVDLPDDDARSAAGADPDPTVAPDGPQEQDRASDSVTAGATEDDGDAAAPASPPVAKLSQATALVQLAEQTAAELFHTPAHDPYATITVGDHRETWPVKAKPFRRWLSRLFYQRHGKAPGSQAVHDAIGVLEGTALFEGPQRAVAVRVAQHGQGAIWVDLGNQRWETVEITPAGWRVAASQEAPVRFRRPAGLGPLPAPQPAGPLGLEELRGFCNVDTDHWPLLLGFLVAALRPAGPYPVLNLLGAQGSAKTTTARVLRALVDPTTAGLRAEPRDMRDLAIAAANSHLVGFDNLSKLAPWLSDGLCRLATGGAFATRELHTDADETLFAFQRPVLLTGIEELAVRGDLADRSLLLDLPAIAEHDRQPERAFWTAFEQAQPRLLGCLLDAVSTALRRLPDVRLARLPRLADFALWVAAAAPALDMDPDDFLKAYEANREAATAMAVEASPVAAEVLRLVKTQGGWQGTASELLAVLNRHAGTADSAVDRCARAWPKSPKALSDALRRAAPNLANVGIAVVFSQSHHPRTVTLQRAVEPHDQRHDAGQHEWVGDAASPASLASHPAAEQPQRGDAAGDARRAGDTRRVPGEGPDAAGGDARDAHRDARLTSASPPKSTPDQGEQPSGDAGGAGDAASSTDSRDGAGRAYSATEGWVFKLPETPCVVCGVGCSNRDPTGRPLHLLCADRTDQDPGAAQRQPATTPSPAPSSRRAAARGRPHNDPQAAEHPFDPDQAAAARHGPAAATQAAGARQRSSGHRDPAGS